MKTIGRVFCRAVQAGFRLAMPLLPYRSPERLGSIGDVPALLRKKGVGAVLLVTDTGLRRFGATRSLEEQLAAQSVRCAVYDGTRANPTVQDVEAAFALYQQAECRAIIAFGGGSPMDCAKAVGARAAYPRRSLRQMKGLLRVRRRLPPLIAIPTTAGTGSEATLAAVITDGETRHKYTMNSFPLIPHYAVLDPQVTASLPPHLTATTGMDALTHAVEAYIGQSTTRETRRLALEATSAIFACIEQACTHGDDLTARAAMLGASHKAGVAFSKSYVGYVHAVAHSLGGQYNIPHGLANAVLLPIVLEHYGPAAHRKLHDLAVAAGIASRQDTDAQAAAAFIAAIREMNARLGIPAALTGIRAEDVPAMAEHAAQEANPLYPVPLLMDAGELEALYHLVAAKA